MDKTEIEAWKRKNAELQYEYRRYLLHHSSKEKELAAKRIQEILEWGPFFDFVSRHLLAFPSGTCRYGLDSVTEKCINEIDEITKGFDRITMNYKQQ